MAARRWEAEWCSSGRHFTPRVPGFRAARYARRMNQPSDPAELSRMARRVVELRQEHRDLDLAIERLQVEIANDERALERTKERKLQPKEQIAGPETALDPDGAAGTAG